LPQIPEQHQRWFDGKTGKWPQFWRRLGYSEIPDLRGKTLLDAGAGLGANSFAAANSGAAVTALEPDSTSHMESKALIELRNVSNAVSIEFTNSSVEELKTSKQYDYIICDELFEHLIDFQIALDAMTELLEPNGRICSGWGPLWRSPTGGHQLVLALAFKKWLPRLTTKPNSFTGIRFRIPYSHRFLTHKALSIFANDRGLPVPTNIQEVGMNGLTLTEFRAMIESSELVIERWLENAGDHFAYKVLRQLSRLPRFRESATSNVYAVLRKK
jgi:SAM-dependent methyltransferase